MGVIVCAATLAAAAAWAGPRGPKKIGELETISLGTPHPHGSGAGANARTWTVRHPGATYIRLHFSRFDLAPGDSLQLANADGTESYVYTGKGPHGTGEFWAAIVGGDAAKLRLQSVDGAGFGFEVDSYGRGTVPLAGVLEPGGDEPAAPESICGVNDERDVACYAGTPEYDEAKTAVLEYVGCCSACTAFKVSDSGQFLTNNHCASTQSGVQSIELRFYYQRPGCGSGTAVVNGTTHGALLLKTDATLDYTLFSTNSDTSSVPCAQLENRRPNNGEPIYIPGHPAAGPKRLSIDSDLDAGGKCTVASNSCTGNAAGTDVCYSCDTEGGSSGSPVFSGVTDKVVALHHFGGCYNSGARMDLIYPQISSLLGACAGGGSTAVCNNGIKEAGESCDGSNLGGQTCQSLGFGGGALSCTASCAFNTYACTAACRSRGATCTADSQCCSTQCSGKPGRQTCK
jgi:hypothetical protein